jgi:hypothetical protein
MSARWTTWLRVAMVGMVASVATAMWSVRQAVRTEPLPALEQPPAAGDVERTERRAATRVNIAAAADADPFHPERKRPDEPYRFPGEVTQTQPQSGPRAQQLRLMGTVVATRGGGFVFCQIGSQPPQLVHIGGQIGPYTLKTVEAGRAVFTGPGGTPLELTFSQPAQSGR